MAEDLRPSLIPDCPLCRWYDNLGNIMTLDGGPVHCSYPDSGVQQCQGFVRVLFEPKEGFEIIKRTVVVERVARK